MNLDETFEHNFDCQKRQELPGGQSSKIYYFPGSRSNFGQDGYIFEINPFGEGRPWIGVFAFGKNSANKYSAVLSHPNPSKLCVISWGDGYIVDTVDPQRFYLVDCHPICNVIASKKHKLLVFSNFTEFIAYGFKGFAWRSKRVGWSDLNITEVTDDFVKGNVWDIRSESEIDFSLEISTGLHTGGIDEI